MAATLLSAFQITVEGVGDHTHVIATMLRIYVQHRRGLAE